MKAPKVQEQLEQALLPAGVPVHQPRVSGRPPEPAWLCVHRLFLVGVGAVWMLLFTELLRNLSHPPGAACAGSQGLSTRNGSGKPLSPNLSISSFPSVALISFTASQ